jgi:hypothetical protein
VILIVKLPFALPAGLALSLALSGCGQTGPLYMPKTPPPGHHGAARPAPAPVAPAQPAVPALTGSGIGTGDSPPAPAAGTVGPTTDSNANDTQAIQPPATPPTQQ